uniref:Uncharacterized protein n=1 Tax=Arundo donax TaxID=35708 RepID=A0A0A9CH81_ARUDO
MHCWQPENALWQPSSSSMHLSGGLGNRRQALPVQAPRVWRTNSLAEATNVSYADVYCLLYYFLSSSQQQVGQMHYPLLSASQERP